MLRWTIQFIFIVIILEQVLPASSGVLPQRNKSNRKRHRAAANSNHFVYLPILTRKRIQEPLYSYSHSENSNVRRRIRNRKIKYVESPLPMHKEKKKLRKKKKKRSKRKLSFNDGAYNIMRGSELLHDFNQLVNK